MKGKRDYSIGIDILDDTAVLGIIGMETEPVWRGSASLREDDPEGSLASLAEALADAGRRYPISRVGIVCGGMINMADGTIRHPAFGEEPFPIRDALNEASGLPVWLDSPATACLMAEWTAGACMGVENAIYLDVSDNISGAVITEGTLLRGRTGSAGAVGHIITHAAGGRDCVCGMKGCMNAYANINELGAIAGRDPEAVMLLASDGDRSMRDMEIRYLGELAAGLCGLIAIFDPNTIVLGGQITRGGRYLLEALHRVLEENAPAYMDGELLLTYARHRTDGRVVGAAALAEYYIPEDDGE